MRNRVSTEADPSRFDYRLQVDGRIIFSRRLSAEAILLYVVSCIYKKHARAGAALDVRTAADVIGWTRNELEFAVGQLLLHGLIDKNVYDFWCLEPVVKVTPTMEQRLIPSSHAPDGSLDARPFFARSLSPDAAWVWAVASLAIGATGRPSMGTMDLVTWFDPMDKLDVASLLDDLENADLYRLREGIDGEKEASIPEVTLEHHGLLRIREFMFGELGFTELDPKDRQNPLYGECRRRLASRLMFGDEFRFHISESKFVLPEETENSNDYDDETRATDDRLVASRLKVSAKQCAEFRETLDRVFATKYRKKDKSKRDFLKLGDFQRMFHNDHIATAYEVRDWLGISRSAAFDYQKVLKEHSFRAYAVEFLRRKQNNQDALAKSRSR